MGHYLVVGGTYGIGQAIAETLQQQGESLTLWARKPAPQTSSPLVVLDPVTTPIPAEAVPSRLDGLVYCPSSLSLKPFGRLRAEDFLADFHTHVLGFVNCLQACLPSLKAAGSARVVGFSSVAVSRGMPYHASIAASKGALEGLCRSLAAEFAPHININLIAPSLTQTPLTEKLTQTPEKIAAAAKRHPLGRIGQPQDIAALAAFLLSEQASWITGQVIACDGGLGRLQPPG